MNIETAKQINLADYLHSLGYSPVKQQGINLWYKSPLREETEASFKVNTERNQWYDFGLGKGGGIIELAAHLYATDHVPLPAGADCGTDTACTPGIFLFWQAGLFRSELPAAGDSTIIVSCPACLLTR